MSKQSITSLLKHNDYHITQIKFYPFRSVVRLFICSLLKCFIKFKKINIFCIYSFIYWWSVWVCTVKRLYQFQGSTWLSTDIWRNNKETVMTSPGTVIYFFHSLYMFFFSFFLSFLLCTLYVFFSYFHSFMSYFHSFMSFVYLFIYLFNYLFIYVFICIDGTWHVPLNNIWVTT